MNKQEQKVQLQILLISTLNNYYNNIRKHYQMLKIEQKVMIKQKM